MLAIRALAVTAIVGLACAGAAEAAGLTIRQRSNGLPGLERGESVVQDLKIGDRAFKVVDVGGSKRYLLVQLDDELVLTVDPDLQLYMKETFESFRQRREKSDIDKEAARKAVLEAAGSGKITAQEKEQSLRDLCLREDGERIVEVQREKVVVGGRRAERVAILENGCKIIEVSVTDEIEEYEPPRALYEFYDRCGLFHPEVVSELKKIEGFPLKIYVNVDYARARVEITSEVLGDPIESGFAPDEFKVPASFKLVAAFPQAGPGEKECPICGAKVTPDLDGFQRWVFRGTEYWFDSIDHKAQFVRKPH